MAVLSLGLELDDPDGTISRAYDLDGGGAVLVRPDGYVAWRSRESVRDPRVELAAAVDHVLGRSSGADGLLEVAS